MGKQGGRKVIRFYNNSGKLDNVVNFLEETNKKVNFINLNCTVDGNEVKISLFGPKDIQFLATEKLREIANRYFE